MSFYALLPDSTTLLSLQPEELAGLLLQYLNSLPVYQRDKLNRHNFFSVDAAVSGYPNELHNEIKRALMEAWMWLENEGFLAPKPGLQGNWVLHNTAGKADAQRRTRCSIPSSEFTAPPTAARSNCREGMGNFYPRRI